MDSDTRRQADSAVLNGVLCMVQDCDPHRGMTNMTMLSDQKLDFSEEAPGQESNANHAFNEIYLCNASSLLPPSHIYI